jgi:steroid delta-isomerase
VDEAHRGGVGRVDGHLRAFNAAVSSGAWEAFAVRFSEDAVMRFPQLPVPDAVGRDAIAAAYRSSPPTDTMIARVVRSTGDRDEVDFAWSGGGSGTMILQWADGTDGGVQALDVLFDGISSS